MSVPLSRIIREEDSLYPLLTKLNSNKIEYARDVISRTEIELMQILDTDRFTVKKLIKVVSTKVAPQSINFTLNERKNFFATSLPALDQCLHGGIPFSTITEIVGPAGCGKTQFSLMLSVLATIPKEFGGLEGNVIYIDTESAFSAARLVEIASNRLPDYFSDAHKIEKLTQSISIYFIQTTEALLERLTNLEEEIIKNNVKFIVLDSIASLVRKEIRGAIERTDILAREASILKYLSATFQIPVFVTNQVTTRFDTPVGFEKNKKIYNPSIEESPSNYVVAALGNTWSHAVNTRLIVEYSSTLDQELRKVKISKSPIAPFSSFYYKINTSGIVLQDMPQGNVNQDPMNMVLINPRFNPEFKN